MNKLNIKSYVQNFEHQHHLTYVKCTNVKKYNFPNHLTHFKNGNGNKQ